MKWRGWFEIEGETFENTLGNGGQQMLLDAAFRGAAFPSTFYLRLFQNSLAAGVVDPEKDDTIADLAGEVAGSGYAPYELARNSTDWPTLSLDQGDYRVRSKTVSVQPSSGTWTPFNYLVIATSTGGGPVIAWARTAEQRILSSPTVLPVVYNVKLS